MAQHTCVYRGLLRELGRTKGQRNQEIATCFRSWLGQAQRAANIEALQDADNALQFLRSQREHQVLVQRYNPLTSLTEQERIRKTANRVGLDVPEGPADLA
ncbi:hypothetical protein Ac2012v2_003887 [Leucoagaricus gongylophorus]